MTLSRRTVLGGALAGAAALALAGCGGSGGSGDRLRVAFPGGGSRESLDPHVVPQFVDQARAKACFDVLAGWSQDMAPVPRLAESWESDASGTRWRIRLRSARWHDGRPVTATDVLATWRRIADPATSASAAASYRTVDFATSRAASATELDVVLSAPNSFFPLAWGAPGAEILPEGRIDPARPVGCGPFRFVSFTPGRSAVYSAYEGYWDGVPPSRELEFVVIDDENARVGALLSGQVAWVHDLRPTSARQLESDSRARLVSAPDSNTLFLPVRVDRPPFSDPRLREAVRLGIDREALVRVVLLGRGRPGNDMFGAGLEYYPTDVPQVTRDVDRARALVTEAGAQGLAFDLQTSTASPTFDPAAGLIAQQLTEIGLRPTVRQLPSENYFTAIRTTGVASLTRSGTLPIPDNLARRAVSTATQANYTGFRDTRIDDLVARASAATDPAVRDAAVREAQLLLRAESGNLVWASGAYDVGTAAHLAGYDVARTNSATWARFDRARLG
ncbi:ABC transporter substrate-binding protein [Actinomycetospora sp. OC33-EN08]|uniref:ABC transporter substrate-binding protein n=1 Tax=Actinomycetospora aurantiaca TaxID=3129233 RepID=A0ABU8ML82_9PSEU